MKQGISRIKQLADKAFVRPDRTEVLSETLLDSERRIELIKQTCEITVKKVSGCLQSQGLKEGTAIEKRIKKVPEFILGSSMVEYGSKLSSTSTLGEVLEEAGKIEMKVGSEMIEFEEKIEKLILIPLQKLIQDDLPSIYKLRRTLSKLTESMDTAKARLSQASNRHSMSSSAGGDKMVNYKEEVEDCQQKVEQCRDNLCAEMNQLISREPEIAQYIVLFLKFQMEYHQKMSSTLSDLLPEVDVILANRHQKTVYGVDLAEHLNASQRTIAAPIELCVCGLLEIGMEEEGLLRIAGSASKVKKLKSEFDVGIINLHGLLADICDPHVISNALKCYLRELPQPLLTTELYHEWLNAIKVSDNQDKLQSLWKVVQQLPEHNLNNLRYLIKFLKLLTTHQDVNKMSPSNIAIVIGPNLVWAPPVGSNMEDSGENNPMDLTATHLFSAIVDQLITYADWFFPGDIEFYITCKKPTEEELIALGIGTRLENGMTFKPEEDSTQTHPSVKRSQSTSSLDDNSPPQCASPKPILRRKNKQAPVPPKMTTSTEFTSSATHTPTHTRHGSAGAVASHLDRDKREGGFYIPPSPSQMKNTNKTEEKFTKSVPPPKPPQPTKFSKEKADTSNHRPSSFRSKIGSMENEILESGTTASPVSTGSTSLQYSVSLPRRFHTENSYKNTLAAKGQIGTGTTATTINSPVVPVPAPSPPSVKESKVVTQKESVEKVETDTVKESQEKEKASKESSISSTPPALPPGPPRPVPAPRSSLNAPASLNITGVSSPLVKERPSVMAKPKDLNTKRAQADSHSRPRSGSGGESDDGHKVLAPAEDNSVKKEYPVTSTSTPSKSVIKSEGDIVEKHDSGTPTKQPQLQSPVNPNSPFRPPRPHPPPPPKAKGSVPGPGESTDL